MQATIVFEKNWEAIHAKNADGSIKYRYIINTGSSRSSKTHSIIQIHYLLAFQKRRRISIWRETKKDTKDTVLADFKKSLPNFEKSELISFNKTESIYTFPTNSTIEICGGDDEQKIHGFQGDIAHLNEPYGISKETFNQIDMRTTEFIIIDWNPRSSHWIEALSKQNNAIVIHSTFRDNPFVPEQQRLKILSYEPTDYNIEQGTANDWMWQVYGLGLKAERPNRIFHWKKIPRAEYDAIEEMEYTAVDWGKSDPWGILDGKYYDGALYFRERNYRSENQIRESLGPEGSQFANDHEGIGIVTWMFDLLKIPKNREVICDNNRPLKIAGLRRAGWEYSFPAIKPQGSVIDGIDLLQNMNIYYTDDSPNIHYEQENYSWKVDRYGILLEEPQDADNHLIDPARYLAQYLLKKGIIKIV